jgi:hypothetical protein
MGASNANRRPASRCRMLIAAGRKRWRREPRRRAACHEAPQGPVWARRRCDGRTKAPALGPGGCVVGLLLWPPGACRNPSSLPCGAGERSKRHEIRRVEAGEGRARPMGVLSSGRGPVGDALRLQQSKTKRTESVVAGGGRLVMRATGARGTVDVQRARQK